jgi:Mg/Co/Ni transporter MgtE
VITDRDLVWMISEGLDPKVATISQFVRPPVETVSTSDGLREVIGRMRELGVRRLPVVDTEKRLVGVISMDDVLLLLGREIADVTEAIAGEFEHEHQMGAARRQASVG